MVNIQNMVSRSSSFLKIKRGKVMKKILFLSIIFTSSVFSAGEEGCCSITENAISTTADKESNSDRPYIVVINGNTIMHCYTNGSCVVIEN